MTQPVRRRAQTQSGFALLLVFLMAAAIAISLYWQIPRVAFQAQRKKEQLLIERGEQYKRAIQLFVRANGRYPAKIEDLENFNNRRFLRHKFVDPMTGKEEWRLIHINAAGVFTDSIANKKKEQKDAASQNTFVGEQAFLNVDSAQGKQGAVNAATRRRESEGGAAPVDANGQPLFGPGNAPPPGAPGGVPQPGNPIDSANAGQINAPLQPGAPGVPAPGFPGQPNAQNPNQQLIAGMPAQPGQLQNGINTPPGSQPGAPPNPNTVTPPVPVPGQPFPGAVQSGIPQPGAPAQPGIPPNNGIPQVGVNPAAAPNPASSAPTSSFVGGSSSFVGSSSSFVGGGSFVGSSTAGIPGASNPGIAPNTMPQPNYTPPNAQNPPFGQPGQVNQPGQFNQPPQFNPNPGSFANQQATGTPQQQQQAANVLNNILTQPRPDGLAKLQAQNGTAPGQTQTGPAIGAGIAGVASTNEAPAIMVYSDHTNYNEWEFIFDVSKQKPVANPNGVPGTPAQALGSMPAGLPKINDSGPGGLVPNQQPGATPFGAGGIGGATTAAAPGAATATAGATTANGTQTAGQQQGPGAPGQQSAIPPGFRFGRP
ncbi:MAG: hypothetical protein JOZ22_13435 [Acidobacteriia bacterium]|nr:hypothetical protein [Terriglobia bacterium]